MSSTPVNKSISQIPTVSSHDVTPHHGHHGHHHHHHPVRRLRQLLHPDGRKLHIAVSPEEAEQVRRALRSGTNVEGHADSIVHGSPEHVEALRAVQSHHEELRDTLREKHGELFDEVETIIRQLDIFSEELHVVTENIVELDANFSKYGYSAHIRTHNRDSPNRTSLSLTNDGSSTPTSQADWDAERYNGKVMRFWVKPVVRQYMHKGLLWRSEEKQEVSQYELFIDLLYVGILQIVGDNAASDPTGASLLQFCVTFIMGWKIWTDIVLTIQWFEHEDIWRRLCILFSLTCLFGFTTNISGFYNDNYVTMVSFFLAARAFQALSWAFTAYLIKMIRWTMIFHTATIVISMAFWIGSISVGEWNRQILIWLAIFFDVLGQPLWTNICRHIQNRESTKPWFEKHMAFFPAINIEHRIERTGAFVILVLGYSVVGNLYQNADVIGINAFFGKAVLGLLQAFCIGSLYFEMDMFNIHVHAIRRSVYTALIWFAVHLPFMMGYVLAGAALSKLVLIHDGADESLEYLSEEYRDRSEPEISVGLRWFYCAGLGISLVCTAVISMTHIYKVPVVLGRKRKITRLVLRAVTGIIIVFLGFNRSMKSLQLVATTSGLVLLNQWVELLGNMACEQCQDNRGEFKFRPWAMMMGFFGRKQKCKYWARCHISKKDLEARSKDGKIVIEELEGEKGHIDHG